MGKSQEDMSPIQDGIWAGSHLDTDRQDDIQLPERHSQGFSRSLEHMESRAPMARTASPAGRHNPYDQHAGTIPADVGSPIDSYHLEDEYLPARPQYCIGSPIHHLLDPRLQQTTPYFSSDSTDENPRVNPMVVFAESSLLRDPQLEERQTMTPNEREQFQEDSQEINYGGLTPYPHGMNPQGEPFGHASSLAQPWNVRDVLGPEYREYVTNSVSSLHERGTTRHSHDSNVTVHTSPGSGGWHNMRIHQTDQTYSAHDVAHQERASLHFFPEVRVSEGTPPRKAGQTEVTDVDSR